MEVVTQVFPDEFHLYTLDQFLSATARLNPHVNVKAIVVGLMDRLSAYAQRESDTETPEQRKKNEEESIANLLEQLRIGKEKKEIEAAPSATQQNGSGTEDAESSTEVDSMASSTTAVSRTESEAGEPAVEPTEQPAEEPAGEIVKTRGIPNNVKLFEIFHEQVAALVKMQRLTIQDTIGLLVSLANLAL